MDNLNGRYHELWGLQAIDPFSTGDHISYTSHLTALNRSFMRRTRKYILDDLPQEMLENGAILTVGSDARYEKGIVSPLEFIVVAQSRRKSQEYKDYLNGFIGNDPKLSRLFDEVENDGIERKDLQETPVSICTLYEGTDRQVQFHSVPRALDLKLLAGSEKMYHFLMHKFVDEIKDPLIGRTLLEKTKKRRKEFQKVIETGVQRFKGEYIRHYSPEQGISYYDEKDQHSFKQGPLRSVQFRLASDITARLKNEFEDIDYWTDLPTNTTEKLEQLEVDGNLQIGRIAASELIDCYKFFLWEYHRSQVNYFINNEAQTELEPYEMRSRLKVVAEITKNPILKM